MLQRDNNTKGVSMKAVIAKLNVAEGKEAEFEKAMLDLVAQVNEKEEGCDLYTLCKDADGNYFMMELYKDQAALDAHGKTEHFRASGASFAGVMAGAPEITRLDVIG